MTDSGAAAVMQDNEAGLIADIGATNARFALADTKGVSEQTILQCADYPGIAEAVQDYLGRIGNPPVRHASVAIAGPIKKDRFEMTNHLWSFSISETRQRLGLDTFHLMNDFEAIALAVPHLKAGQDYRQVGDGAPAENAPIGVIGPGTGLGVGSLFWQGGRYHAVPGEGGHVTMPAKTQRDLDIFQWLLGSKYHHVSAERVCSGKGLVNVYNALRGLDGRDDLPDLEPKEISMRALSGECALCAEALDLMMGFLGTVAGNLALTLGAHGGIYIAGGIALKLGDYFDNSRFRQEFAAKGRFSDYMSGIPTYLITNKFAAFIGLHADLVRYQTAG